MKDVLQRFPELDEIQTFSEYNHVQYVLVFPVQIGQV